MMARTIPNRTLVLETDEEIAAFIELFNGEHCYKPSSKPLLRMATDEDREEFMAAFDRRHGIHGDEEQRSGTGCHHMPPV